MLVLEIMQTQLKYGPSSYLMIYFRTGAAKIQMNLKWYQKSPEDSAPSLLLSGHR